MITESKTIHTRDGLSLNLNVLENGSSDWIIATHGLGENSDRHRYLLKLFSQRFNICLYDLRGHGKSTGKRGHINNFKDFVQDLDEVLHFLKDQYSMSKYNLLGHSMGSLITASYMQNYAKKEFYPEKVFLSGPVVSGAGVLGKAFHLTPLTWLNKIKNLPISVPLSGLLDLSKLSHDPRVLQNYLTDDLNILKIHSKLFLELLAESKNVFSRPLRIDCDLYCAVGSEDGLIDAPAAIEYFQNVEKNAKLKVFTGAYHEIHNEIQKYREPYFEFLTSSFNN